MMLGVRVLTAITLSGICVMDSQNIGKQSGLGLYTLAFQIKNKKEVPKGH